MVDVIKKPMRVVDVIKKPMLVVDVPRMVENTDVPQNEVVPIPDGNQVNVVQDQDQLVEEDIKES